MYHRRAGNTASHCLPRLLVWRAYLAKCACACLCVCVCVCVCDARTPNVQVTNNVTSCVHPYIGELGCYPRQRRVEVACPGPVPVYKPGSRIVQSMLSRQGCVYTAHVLRETARAALVCTCAEPGGVAMADTTVVPTPTPPIHNTQRQSCY